MRHEKYNGPVPTMGHKRTASGRRYTCAHLICAYLLMNHITRAVVTVRDIAQFHHLSLKSSRSVSVMLDFMYTNRIRKTHFGFYNLGTAPYKKTGYPHQYTIELIDQARGRL